MTLEFNVVVIGGGIVGLTAALAMAQRGHTVAVIEAGSLKIDASAADTRVYAINGASHSLLQDLDVWGHLDKTLVSPYRKMFVWDGANGAHIDFDSRCVAAQNLGNIIGESVLKKALLQQIALQSSIVLFPNTCVDEVLTAAYGVTVCSKERSWNGQLLLIADGAQSQVRQKLKVELYSWAYEQHALIATVSVEKAHQQTAYQVFHPNGSLAFLPLVDSHHCSIVWATDPSHVKSLMNCSAQEFNELVTQAFDKKLGDVAVISTRAQFPLTMRHVKQYTGTRWLLLGDAAHTIHPLAGLGLNVGLADVRAWMHCLDAVQDDILSKKALGVYQRERKNSVWQIIMLMEAFKRVFTASFVPMVVLRGLGLRVCNELTLLKRLFIRYAQDSMTK